MWKRLDVAWLRLPFSYSCLFLHVYLSCSARCNLLSPFPFTPLSLSLLYTTFALSPGIVLRIFSHSPLSIPSSSNAWGIWKGIGRLLLRVDYAGWEQKRPSGSLLHTHCPFFLYWLFFALPCSLSVDLDRRQYNRRKEDEVIVPWTWTPPGSAKAIALNLLWIDVTLETRWIEEAWSWSMWCFTAFFSLPPCSCLFSVVCPLYFFLPISLSSIPLFGS